MNSFAHVPPGFRFHPTDEELVDYYLRKKISSGRIDLDIIKEIDLYKIEPWDLQEKCNLSSKEQNEWYFFSHKDKKYPTGTRTNRATTVGFWKATGRDKAIYCKQNLVGMRKTLVFYEGRAPNGQKSDYIMHEYRLETNENAAPQEEGWVVCRVFKKRLPTILHKGMEHDDSPCWYDEQAAVSLTRRFSSAHQNEFSIPYLRRKELELHHHQFRMHPYDSFLQLPQLESPKVQNSISIASYGGTGLDINHSVSTTVESSSSSLKQEEMQHYLNFLCGDDNNNEEQAAVGDDDDQQAVTTDWRVLEKFVASQLVQQDNISASSCKERPNYSDSINGDNGCNASADDHINILVGESHEELEPTEQCASTSATSSCQINLWK